MLQHWDSTDLVGNIYTSREVMDNLTAVVRRLRITNAAGLTPEERRAADFIKIFAVEPPASILVCGLGNCASFFLGICVIHMV